MLPEIDLPDLLFEVHAWTGFLDAFVHLVALTRARLVHVDQYYLRADTITAANARLIAAQAAVPIVKF